MKKALILFIGLFLFSCNTTARKIEVDPSKHTDLIQLESMHHFTTLHSEGQIEQAKQQTALVAEAYDFLSEIMGPKKDFFLLVVAAEDWSKNAYSEVSGMPEYYKGNLIVGAGQNSLAQGYEAMLRSFPETMTNDLIKTYTNASGEFDMRLFFDKLVIHELTHSFQDPENGEGYSMSRWLEELHANMGLYAFYKAKRPEELKYITTLVDFSIENPPPGLKYKSLTDFDQNYYEMDPGNYGDYQMKFTKSAQEVIDSLGNAVLKPLNEFLIKYDASWKGKLSETDFKQKIANEVDPYFVELMNSW